MPESAPLRVIARDGARLIGRFIRSHPVSFGIGVFGAANFAGAIVMSAVVIGGLTDSVIVPALDRGADTTGLGGAIAALIVISLWKAVGIVIRRMGAGWTQIRSQMDMRTELVEHLYQLELSWLRKQSTGDLLAVSDSDAAQSTHVLGPLPYATGAVLLFFGSMVMIFLTDPVLGAVATAGLVTKVVLLDVRGSWKIFGLHQIVQTRRGETSGVAHESIDGALTVKALGREDYEVARFRSSSERLRDDYVKVARVFTFFDSLQDSVPALTTVVVLLIGAVRVGSGDLTAGDLLLVTYLLSLVTFPLRLIGFVLWDAAASLAGWYRVKAVLDIDDRVAYGSRGARDDETGALVESDEVSFRYVPEVPVLRDINFEITPGDTIAVVGATGSGKSTLVTLLARLWDPTVGSMQIDGRDLRSFARSALAQEVAFVGQEAFLFDDTVANNIGFGLDVSMEEIEQAARMANAHSFIMDLPLGYDTRIGERGATLSGGQRQRTALARALVRRPRLLILDDATSAVDPSVEAEILAGLRRAEMPSTVVLVAYRRSSISLADQVVFVEDGRVVAQGTHADLLKSVPGYSRIVQAYEMDAEAREEAS